MERLSLCFRFGDGQYYIREKSIINFFFKYQVVDKCIIFLYPGMKSENCTRKLEINYIIDVVRYSLITSFLLIIVEMVRPKNFFMCACWVNPPFIISG